MNLFGFTIPTKWIVIGALALAGVVGLGLLVDDYFHVKYENRRKVAVIKQMTASRKAADQEAARLAKAAQARYMAVRDAFREIENVKDDCTDSPAGRIAIDRVRQILNGDGADRP